MILTSSSCRCRHEFCYLCTAEWETCESNVYDLREDLQPARREDNQQMLYAQQIQMQRAQQMLIAQQIALQNMGAARQSPREALSRHRVLHDFQGYEALVQHVLPAHLVNRQRASQPAAYPAPTSIPQHTPQPFSLDALRPIFPPAPMVNLNSAFQPRTAVEPLRSMRQTTHDAREFNIDDAVAVNRGMLSLMPTIPMMTSVAENTPVAVTNRSDGTTSRAPAISAIL